MVFRYCCIKINHFHLWVNYSDWKCGKLICTYKSDSLITKTSATTIYANISGKICISLEYDQNDRDKEKMWVKEGTVCDKRKVGRLLPNNF